MRLEDCAELCGGSTLLTEEQELSPTEDVKVHVEISLLLVKLQCAENDEAHRPEKPYSPCLKWLSGRCRVVLGVETSVHMKLDGTRRFINVSVLHKPPDAPMPQVCCSVLGACKFEGDCFALMLAIQRDFKRKDERTARGTVFVDRAPQIPQWAHNETGSFNESDFFQY
jgi:hypothetical protein